MQVYIIYRFNIRTGATDESYGTERLVGYESEAQERCYLAERAEQVAGTGYGFDYYVER
jgi:hypothetical protein